jgi:hypothetical protein
MSSENGDLEFFNAALEFLEDGIALPDTANNDARSRFRFQAQIWKHIYQKSKSAQKLAESNQKQLRMQWMLILLSLALIGWHVGVPLLGIAP